MQASSILQATSKNAAPTFRGFDRINFLTAITYLSLECSRNEKKKNSVDFSMDFLESEEIIFNPWIEYPWIAVYFIDPWMKSGYK